MGEVDFDNFVLANMPRFIAVNYLRLLKAQKPQEQVELVIHIYMLALRTFTINLICQYLLRDRDKVRDSYLDNLLLQKFNRLTSDAWRQLFFTVLRAYEERRDLFFVPELYDFYWDTSVVPRKRRIEVERLFERLNQVEVGIQTKQEVPKDESGWKALADEVLGLLKQILDSLSFIGKYDLIRIITQDEQTYTFELHKGTDVIVSNQPLPRLTRLIPGWFFLRTASGRFLPLYPLMVFWEEEIITDSIAPADTGVFDRIVSEHLRYLLIMPGSFRTDNEHINEFIDMIYRALVEDKRLYRTGEKLTWVQLCDICKEISEQRMSTVRLKYREELYLQRNTTLQKYKTFLASEKRCFVLIGKSGVGKSNFLLALRNELEESRSDICTLMYDGANLRVMPSLTEAISKDFSERLILSDRQIQKIWHEIATIDGIEDHLVILCVDAINENPQAGELLKQLNELVQQPWPWLKIVFSSRPETWQGIKHGIKLAEALYYRELGTETIGIELERFSYSEKIEPFSYQELPSAYAKYMQTFNLLTPFEDLSSEMREMLRDPLNLWLIAKTYQKREISRGVKISELIEQYINALVERELLQVEDLRFLVKRLIPLMVRREHFSSKITAAELEDAGDSIYDLIYKVWHSDRAAPL